MKILVVDDEPLARARILKLLEQNDQVELVLEAENAYQALKSFEQNNPDVVLMDIRMPGMDGLEAAGHLMKNDLPPAIIFTTAYEEHALKAFDLQAIGYLVKPVNKEKLFSSLETAQRLTTTQVEDVASESPKYLSARIAGDIQLLAVKEVIYFRADQKYVVAKHLAGELLLEDSLKSLEERHSNQFLRIHRNALVAVDKISGLSKNDKGHAVVCISEVEEQLEVSRRHLPELRKSIKDRSSS